MMPRPRFTMRVALLAVAVICGWLGWQASIVRERKSILATVEACGGVIVYPDKSELPPVRQWMGEEDVIAILVPEDATGAIQARIRVAFPETQIVSASQEASQFIQPSR